MVAKVDVSTSGANALARKKSDKQVEVAPPIKERIRLSIDIDLDDYRRLMSWCADIAPVIGRVSIKNVWVVRALVKELWSDQDLMKRVIERVREEHGPDAD